jgi:hypothetical protein
MGLVDDEDSHPPFQDVYPACIEFCRSQEYTAWHVADETTDS